MKISLAIIVKDEQAVILRCLDSFAGLAEEIILVDTGSTDETVGLVREHYPEVDVHHFKWIDDFAAARNHALSLCSGDWIMWVDADDVMHPEQNAGIRDFLVDLGDDVQAVDMPYIYSSDDHGNAELKYWRTRIFRNGHGFRWVGRIHEYLSFPKGAKSAPLNIDIMHYRDEGKGTQNSMRNLLILEKIVGSTSTPENELPRYLFYAGKECIYNRLYSSAINHFSRYLSLPEQMTWHPERCRSVYEMALARLNLGDTKEATLLAMQAISMDEAYPEPYILLGQIAYNQNNWEGVVRWMVSATFLPEPETRFFDYLPYMTYVPFDYLTIALWNLGDYDNALIAAAKCLEYRPTDERFIANHEFIKAKVQEGME